MADVDRPAIVQKVVIQAKAATSWQSEQVLCANGEAVIGAADLNEGDVDLLNAPRQAPLLLKKTLAHRYYSQNRA